MTTQHLVDRAEFVSVPREYVEQLQRALFGMGFRDDAETLRGLLSSDTPSTEVDASVLKHDEREEQFAHFYHQHCGRGGLILESIAYALDKITPSTPRNDRCTARVKETAKDERSPGPANPPRWCCLPAGHDGKHKYNFGGQISPVPFRDSDEVEWVPDGRNGMRASALLCRALINDDGYACSFQSMAQYRTALIAKIDGLVAELSAAPSHQENGNE